MTGLSEPRSAGVASLSVGVASYLVTSQYGSRLHAVWSSSTTVDGTIFTVATWSGVLADVIEQVSSGGIPQ